MVPLKPYPPRMETMTSLRGSARAWPLAVQVAAAAASAITAACHRGAPFRSLMGASESKGHTGFEKRCFRASLRVRPNPTEKRATFESWGGHTAFVGGAPALSPRRTPGFELAVLEDQIMEMRAFVRKKCPTRA